MLLQFWAVELWWLLVILWNLRVHTRHTYGRRQLSWWVVLIWHVVQMDRGRTVVVRWLMPTAAVGCDNTSQVHLAPVRVSYPVGRLTIAHLRLGIRIWEGCRLVQLVVLWLLLGSLILAVPHVGVNLGRTRDRILSYHVAILGYAADERWPLLGNALPYFRTGAWMRF